MCKSAPAFIYEAMECLGGNGYVEEGMLARLYREAPVNAIWEGSGNVMCLDVLRALAREADQARAVLTSLAQGCAGLPGTAEAAAFIVAAVSAHRCGSACARGGRATRPAGRCGGPGGERPATGRRGVRTHASWTPPRGHVSDQRSSIPI